MPDPGDIIGHAVRIRCGCVWLDLRCPNDATAEDGLCNWCAPFGARTDDQMRADPNVLLGSDGAVVGLGGAGQLHDAPLADRLAFVGPRACWYENSGRTIACPVENGDTDGER